MPFRRIWLHAIVAATLLLFAMCCHAAPPPATLDPGTESMPLTPYLSHFHDKSAGDSPENAWQRLARGDFEPVPEGKTAFGLMRNRTDRGWFNMLDKYDATITHEAWDPKYKENEDWNHIWGSAFLNVIQRRVIGVRVLKPGWATWTVRPADNLTAPVKATIPAGGETISLDIDPLARHVTISGGAAVDHFVKTRATDEAWSYNVVKVPR